MSDRLISGNNYYESRQLPPTPMASGLLAAKQQQQTQQQQQLPPMHYYNNNNRATGYDPRGYYNNGSSGYTYGATAPYNGNNYLGHYYGQAHYDASSYHAAQRQRFTPYPQQQHHQNHLHHQHQQQQHLHHHPGMFTAAGQQLVPSSVLHYPPRHNSGSSSSGIGAYANYDPTPQPYHRALYMHDAPYSSYAAQHYSSGGAANAALLTSSRSTTPAPNRTVVPPYLEPLRNYHDSLAATQRRAISDTHQELPLPPLHLNTTSFASSIAAAAVAASIKSPLSTEPSALNSPPEHEPLQQQQQQQRLTTSPPLTSATGTDSGISNCSTRVRSEQSTPVYSSEYPVSMSVESASCVSYHCAADGKEFEETSTGSSNSSGSGSCEEQNANELKVKEATNEEQKNKKQEIKDAELQSEKCLEKLDDISFTTASSTPTTSATSSIEAKIKLEEQHSTPHNANDVNASFASEANTTADCKRQINLADSLQAQTTTPTVEALATEDNQVQLPQSSNSNSSGLKLEEEQQQQQQTINAQEPRIWSPYATTTVTPYHSPNSPISTTTTTKRQRVTPPAPHNSPIGYGGIMQTMLPAMQPQHTKSNVSAQKTTNGNVTFNKNRVMECDLIPSKKSKRKSLQSVGGGGGDGNASNNCNATGKHAACNEEEQQEQDNSSCCSSNGTLREEIQNIKPLPGFQQTFGSTEIGRFSETFLLTPENSLDRCDAQFSDEFIVYEQQQLQLQQQQQQETQLHATHSPATPISHLQHMNNNNNSNTASYGYTEHSPNSPYFLQQQQQQILQQQQQQSHNHPPHDVSNWSSNSYETLHDFRRSRFNATRSTYGLPPDYMSYERYGYGHPRSRFGEIRCNGY